MIRRRRTLAPLLALLVGTAGVGAFVPGAARAQADPTECTATTQDELKVEICTPPGAQSSTATVPLKVTVTDLARRPITQTAFNVTSIRAELLSTEDGQQLPDPAFVTWPGPAANKGTLTWSPEFTTNGRYDLHVTATGDRQPGSSQAADVTAPLTLVVPPHQPTGVDADVASTGKVTVTWSNADREPDLLSYEVSRAKQGSADYARVDFVEVTTTKVVDAPPTGAWKYRVTAVRKGATSTEGIPSTPSRDATAEVAAAGADGGTTGGSSGGAGVGSGSGTGSGTGAGGTAGTGAAGGSSSTTAPSISNAPRSTIDLSVLNSARRTTPTTRRPAEPDPGFQEVLPFDRPSADDPAEEDGPQELGADEPEVGLGERLVSDGGERRRSLGFVAGGLLLFVLGMTGLFLKSEVKRADELDPLDPDADADVVAAAATPRLAESEGVDADLAAAEQPARPIPGRRRTPLPAARSAVAEPASATAVRGKGFAEAITAEPAPPVRGEHREHAADAVETPPAVEPMDTSPATAPAGRRRSFLRPAAVADLPAAAPPADPAPVAALAGRRRPAVRPAAAQPADPAPVAALAGRRRPAVRPAVADLPTFVEPVDVDATASPHVDAEVTAAVEPVEAFRADGPVAGLPPVDATLEPSPGRRRGLLRRAVLEPETPAAADPAADDAGPAEPRSTAPSRLTRARQARAERAAEIAALFEGEAATTAADDSAHLAELAGGRVRDEDAAPVGTHRRVRRAMAPVDDPNLDVPDPTFDLGPAPARKATRAPRPASARRAPSTAKRTTGTRASAKATTRTTRTSR